MCEFCVQHGEGKKWYEVMENYSAELYSQGGREQYIKDFFDNFQLHGPRGLDRLDSTRRKVPFAYSFIRRLGTLHMKKNHFGQVVPLEDAEGIVDMVQSITRIPCVCRSATLGKKDERYCLLLGIDPSRILGDYPDLVSTLETFSPAESKHLLREFDKKGLVHSVWTFKTPFIGAICNCDRDCIGAIEYSAVNQKCYINSLKCYGCGVCRSQCKKGAIYLLDK